VRRPISNDAWSAIVPGRLKVPKLGFAIWSLASSSLRSGGKSRLFDPAHSTHHARRHISLESHDCSQCPNCCGRALRSTEHPSGPSRPAHHLGLNFDAVGTGSRAVGAIVAAAVSRRPIASPVARGQIDAGCKERVRQAVRRHLRTPTLGPTNLRRLVGISRSNLYIIYRPRAIRQAVAAGVKCDEHRHLIDEPAAKLADEGIWWSLQVRTVSVRRVTARNKLPRNPP